MKIGLYLQDEASKNEAAFLKAAEEVSKSDIDMLVFPEYCWFPEKYSGKIKDIAKEVSKLFQKPVLANMGNDLGEVMSFYGNAEADTESEDTDFAFFVKHTYCSISAFDNQDYESTERLNFIPIFLKGKTIGVTICNDLTDPVISAAWANSGIDILVNQTGGNVQPWKWIPYNRVRAIEADAVELCVMGQNSDKSGDSFVMGFNHNGKMLTPCETLINKTSGTSTLGTIYVYDTDEDQDSKEVLFDSKKKAVIESTPDFSIPAGNIDTLLSKATKIEGADWLSYMEYDSKNIIFCEFDDDSFMVPSNVPLSFYGTEISKLEDKRYIIVVKLKDISKEDFETMYSEVLGVRAIENKAIVVLESDKYNMCIMTDNYKHIRYIQAVDGKYNVNLNYAKGPEALWSGDGRKAQWRDKYEWLLYNYETMFDDIDEVE